MSLRKKLITDTAVLFGASSISQLIGFIVIPIFITNLGPEMYGLFAISGVLMGYVNMFDFGLTRGLTREVGHCYGREDYERMSVAVSGGFILLLGVGLLSASVIYFAQNFIIGLLNVPEEHLSSAKALLTVTALFSILVWPTKLPRGILEGNQLIKSSSVIEAIKNSLTSVTLLVAVMVTTDIALIRGLTCLVMVLAVILYFWEIHRKVPELKIRLNLRKLSEMKAVMGYGIKYFYSQLLSLIGTKLDSFIIANMVSLAAVAAYQVVFKVQLLFILLTTNLLGAFLPAVYRLDGAQDKGKLALLLEEALRYRAMLMTPAIAVLIAVAPDFLKLWVGEEYRQYGIWAQAYLLAHYCYIFGLGSTVMRASSKIGFANKVESVRAVINLALSISLVQYFGIGGPILGSVICAIFLGDMVLYPLYCSKNELPWKKSFLQTLAIIAVTIPLWLGAILIQDYFPIDSWWVLILYAAGIGLAGYGLTLGLFSKKKDYEMFIQILRKRKIPC